MTTKQLKEAINSAYTPSDGYPRRKPYSLGPAFDVAVVLFAVVSAAGFFLT